MSIKVIVQLDRIILYEWVVWRMARGDNYLQRDYRILRLHVRGF